MSALACIVAVLLDRLLGEPGKGHPLVGFGALAAWLEQRLHPGVGAAPAAQFRRGALAVLLLVGPLLVLAWLLAAIPRFGWTLEVGLLYLALGGSSLAQHAGQVAAALGAGDLVAARGAVANLVSRDTGALESAEVAAATIESVLENGCDAVFGALFWFAVAGAPGVVAYRLINTLDAMWGYRGDRYRYFGAFAARADDVLNWLPARLTAAGYTVLGDSRTAWQCWRTQGRRWQSPNAGPVMAAGAGALGIRLGGGASYHGRWRERPLLGSGRDPVAGDINRALALVQQALLLWLAVILVLDLSN